MQRVLEMHKQKEERQKPIKCPKCAHESHKKGRKNRLKCLKCHTPFCALCGHKHSPSISCKEWERRGKRDMDAETLKKFGLIRCPNCFTPTEKIDGCNYVTCRCTQPFCWLCGCPLDNTKHFTHFKNAPFGTECIGDGDKSPLVGYGSIRI